MKTKLMFAALAAAAVFTACNKENPVQEPVQPVNKSVVLNLANVMPATKAEGTTIAGGTQITLTDYQVFFADAAGTLHAPMTDTAEPGAETYFSFADEGTPDVTKQFHFLPQSVKEVIVVGNLGKKITAATRTDLMNQVATLDIVAQQKPSALRLYGCDQSLTKVTATHEGQVTPNEDGSYEGEDVHPEPLFKAEINLHPAVARVEVTGFEYAKVDENTDRNFTTMTVENLSVINWYEAATVSIVEDKNVNNQFVNGLTVAASGQDTYFGGFYNDDTMYPNYLKPIKENVTPENDDKDEFWYFDYIEQTMPTTGDNAYVLGVDLSEVTDPKDQVGKDCYAYHVFPGATPRFIAELTGVNTVDGVDITTKLYLQTINEFSPVAGNIYRMYFKFNDNDLRAAEKCIQVEITVDKWNVEVITPTFGKYVPQTTGGQN